LLEHFTFRTKPEFFFNPDNLPETDEPDIIIKQAGRLCRHEFDLFGVTIAKPDTKINWHKDYINDYIWPDKFIAEIKLDTTEKTDIKNVWEISRFYHLPVLGQAYLITKDPRYANEIVNQVTDWIEQNPVYYGPNWLCPMEAAIRVCNWLFAWFLIRKAPVIRNKFLSLFLISLKSHGDFIFRNLEKNPLITGNHYLADLASLAYLGILIPELKGSHRWRSFAVKNLEKEIQRQVYPDGVNFEASIPYHRLATELFLYPGILCRMNGIEISKTYWQRLEKMLKFTASYTLPGGNAPQIGDNDSGRLHIAYLNKLCNRKD